MTDLLAAAAGDPSPWLSFMPMILIFGVFYFIWFRPIRNKQKAVEDLVENLKKGDKVVTNGGFHGEVVKVEGNIVLLKIADNVKVKVAKRAVAGLAETPEGNGGN